MPLSRDYETDNGNSVMLTKARKECQNKVPRVSNIGPVVDLTAELQMVENCVETHLFRVVKFVNGSEDLDSTAKGSIFHYMTKKLNVAKDVDRELWWSRTKEVVNKRVNTCRTDANSAMREKYKHEIFHADYATLLMTCKLTPFSPIAALNFSTEVRLTRDKIDVDKMILEM
jgi:hypothetical protein